MNNNTQIPPAQHPDNNEISLIHLWQTLMRRKYVILGVLIIVMVAAVIHLINTPRVYEADTYLLLPKKVIFILSNTNTH